ncbi:amidohydrolase [soil metagenome]
MTTLYTAQWVLPIASATIEDGAVVVEGALIAGVGTRAELLARFPNADVRDYGAAALLPGFVNCHTHLELTAMRGYLEPEESDFFAWLRKLTLARLLKMTPYDLYVSAAWGAVEAARAGVTSVGDASASAEEAMRALGDVGLRGIVYQEVFGPEPELAAEQFAKLHERVAHLQAFESDLVRLGVSPHSPYTVSARLLEMVSDFAVNETFPLKIHTAESAAEELLIREGRGTFAESLAQRGIAWSAPGLSSVQYLARCGVLRARPLLAHCIRVDEQDIVMIKEAGASVAHCPKSNVKLGHGHAPYHLFKKIAHGFGSDSVASNNTCDILEEARFATLMARAAATKQDDGKPAAFTAHEALATATHGGARALWQDTQTGSLVVGQQADLIAIKLDGAHQTPIYDPAHALIFSSSGRDIVLTVVAGREVFRDGRVMTVDEDCLQARMIEIARKLSD